MNAFIELMAKLPLWSLLILSGTSVALGDFFAKSWSVERRSWLILAMVLGYFFSGFFYLPTLLKGGLIVTSMIWSLLSTLALVAIGLFIFHESLTSLQIVGLILGTVAIMVLSV